MCQFATGQQPVIGRGKFAHIKCFSSVPMQQLPSEANQVNCKGCPATSGNSFQNSKLCSKIPITQKDSSTSATQTPGGGGCYSVMKRGSFVICPSNWSEFFVRKTVEKGLALTEHPPGFRVWTRVLLRALHGQM